MSAIDRCVLLLAGALLVAPGSLPVSALAQGPGPLLVATRDVPPFAMRDAEGQWQGISIDLWREIAEALEVAFEFRDVESVDSALQGVASGSLGAAVGAFTITAERERMVDFTHPFFISGLGIAVVAREQGLLRSLLDAILSPTFLTVVSSLALVLFAAGLLVWLFERKANAEQFGGPTAQGLGSGFWWAAVTMTTVGYGDKAPRTAGGRAVGLVWMFASIIMISGFTAGIASALTVQRLDTPIQGPEDLPGNVVGTLAGSTSETYLIRNRIRTVEFESVPQALEALTAGRVDAVVYDRALLRYEVNNAFADDLRVLPRTFEPQEYGIMLPPGSALREPINQALLEATSDDTWRGILHRYLGAD